MDPSEVDKIDRMISEKWNELYLAYSEDERTSPLYLFELSRVQAFREVWQSIAIDLPKAGRTADAAVDAKTTVKVIAIVLERQARMETKLDQLVGYLKFMAPVTAALLAYLITSAFYQGF